MASSESTARSPVSVADFYSDKTVFITGATGFIGETLVAKLLRSCPSIRKIYLLIRPKKEQNTNKRLEQLLHSPIFEEAQSEQPLDLRKIHAIEGDVRKPLLGISTTDYELLVQSVNVVFHSAATVKFNATLKDSVTVNVMGTQQLVELCKKMTNLEALVHVSTAYSNCDRVNIEEVIYPAPMDPELIIRSVNDSDEGVLLTPQFLGKHPNTYTYTKAMTEKWLLDNRGNLPLVIVRPSIVLASIAEPVRGWLNSWNGPTALVAGVGKGIFRSVYARGDKMADFIPVDMVVNLLLVTAWRTGTMPSTEIAIYNCVSGLTRAITWKHFVDICVAMIRQYPFQQMMWYPNATVTSSRFVHLSIRYFLHYLPAYMLDGFRWLVRRKRTSVKIQSMLTKASETTAYFTTQEWNFDDKNVRMLNLTLSDRDRQDFCFDASAIEWDSYIEGYVLGIRRFLIKDEPASIDKARRTLRILYWGNRLTQLIVLVAVIWSIWQIIYVLT